MSTTATPPQRLEQPLCFLHNLATVLVDDSQTDGRFSLVELNGAPGDMPPLHVHDDEDETFYVLEGELELHIAERAPVTLAPGQAAYAPRGLAHVYRVTSPNQARWLVTCTGTGFARLIREIGVPVSAATLPVNPKFDPQHVAETAVRHGITILAPPGTLP